MQEGQGSWGQPFSILEGGWLLVKFHFLWKPSPEITSEPLCNCPNLFLKGIMECNIDEATRAKEIVESKFSRKDMMGAKKFSLKA